MDNRAKRIQEQQRRRRKKLVMFFLSRGAVIVVALGIVFALGFGMLKGISSISGNTKKKETTKVEKDESKVVEKKEKKEEKETEKKKEVKQETRENFSDVEVPTGYEEVYEKLLLLYEEHEEIDYVLYNLESYPLDLLELLSKNVETLEFVKAYPDYEKKEEEGSIKSSEIKEGKIPLFLQWDNRWGYLDYGGRMIGLNGCGPTCLSMVVVGLTGNTEYTPKYIADYSNTNQYYVTDTGTAWALMSQGSSAFGVYAYGISPTAEAIEEQVSAGHPVICSMKPGDFTDQGHYIVIWKVTQEGYWRINDPNSKIRSKQKWDPERVVSQINGLWAFSANQ